MQQPSRQDMMSALTFLQTTDTSKFVQYSSKAVHHVDMCKKPAVWYLYHVYYLTVTSACGVVTGEFKPAVLHSATVCGD